jgi:hypothetical protein
MKKMVLDLDALTVESFATDAPQGRGTVVGAMKVTPGGSEIDACPSAWNCSINGTCMDQICGGDTSVGSCNGTCDFNSGCGCSGPIC